MVMMQKLTSSFLLLAALGSSAASAPPPGNPWKDVLGPTRGPAEIIGFYTAGCLRGALPLQPSGYGYQTMRPSRKRFFGHPTLITFVEKLAIQTAWKGFGTLLIGDLAQPRGGPTLSSHESHQVGLDADIWFWRPPQGKFLTPEDRETLEAPSMLTPDLDRLNQNWDEEKVARLRTVSENASVQRIFVNPVIKKEICRLHRGEVWLSKLRPWFGHDDHFHVRLKCPSGEKKCQAQDPPPLGDGCDETLEEWFSSELKKKAKELRENPPPPKMPVLPAECAQVLLEPFH